MPSKKKHWKIFVIQHSHIDVGYTDRQEAIAEYQGQFIEQAVEMAVSPYQRSRDEYTKFKFTCEGFWAVEQFLARTDQKHIDNFIRALKKGTMELSAFYFHLTELLDQGHLRDSLQPAVDFACKAKVPLKVAMACDINGLSWSMADALYEAGVRYLSTNINPTHGGYPFGKPLIPFYWESPKGKKILVWNGLTYHKTNLFGLMPGFNPDTDPGVPGLSIVSDGHWLNVQDLSLAEKKLFPLVDSLEKNGYEYDFLPLTGSGIYTDNSPPADSYCEHIRRWNEKHGDKIWIQTATLIEFFKHLKTNVSYIPVFKGDWNDWWSDGVISTPLETAIFRNAQRTKRTVEMLDPGHHVISRERLNQISNKLVMFAEHTWGLGESVTKPWNFIVQQVLLRKSKYAVEADEIACTALDKVLRSKGQGKFKSARTFEYKVINPFPKSKRSIAYLPIDSWWESSILKQSFRVVDRIGNIYPYQVSNIPRGQTIGIVLDLDGGEEREFSLEFGNYPIDDIPVGETKNFFENEYYRIQWSPNKGIYSLINRATDNEILDQNGPALCTPVYQIFPNEKGDTAGLMLRSAAGSSSMSRRRIPKDVVTFGKLKIIQKRIEGQLYSTWNFIYEVPGASQFSVELTFFNDLPYFDIAVRMNKDNVRAAEGMYVIFPFVLGGGVWYLDKAGYVIRPGKDQLPGTCCDYYLVQNGAILAGKSEGISISTPDAPMVQIGKLRLWNYSTNIEPTGSLYSWLCNNKWQTNFKAGCGGFYEFRYIVEVNRDFTSHHKALEKCKSHNYPFVSIRK